MHGLAGQTRKSNTNWNTDNTTPISLENSLPRNLEQTMFSLEDGFWYILNNPSCYNEIVWRFFGKNSLFGMFPHVEAFFLNYRLTGRTVNQQPQAVNNIIRGSPSSNPQKLNGGTEIGILEQIEEAEEEMELKRDTQTPESPHNLDDLGEENKYQLIKNSRGHMSSSLPSAPSGDHAITRSDSGKTGASFQVVS